MHRHTGRPVAYGGDRTTLRRAARAREAARHPRQQRRRNLGRAIPRVSRQRLGQGYGPQRQVGVLPDAEAPRPAGGGGIGRGFSRVINIGSIEGIRTSHLEAYSYAASKAGVNHLTRIMAKFLAPKHIAVNAIAPGYFPSKMTDAIDEHGSRQVIEDAPMKRMGAPEDMAGIALYLASRASGFVCGAVIPVDGGL